MRLTLSSHYLRAVGTARSVLSSHYLRSVTCTWSTSLGLGVRASSQRATSAYWVAEAAAREQKAAEKAAAKAAAKAAREAAEAARPKKPRREKEQRRTTVPLPANRDEITVACTRDFLVDPPAAGAENTVPAWAQPPPQAAPIPVPAGLEG